MGLVLRLAQILSIRSADLVVQSMRRINRVARLQEIILMVLTLMLGSEYCSVVLTNAFLKSSSNCA